MPIDVSDFTIAGFSLDIGDKQRFEDEIQKYTQSCETLPLDAGASLCRVKDKSGAELWIGLRRDKDGNAQIASGNPAFFGKARVGATVEADVSDPQYKPVEATIQVRIGDVPVVFSLADAREAPRFTAGAKLDVDIAAFARTPKLFADEAAYMASQAKGEVKFAAEHFITSGMFLAAQGGMADDASKRPAPYADFSGTVLSAELKHNDLGGLAYWWASVRTLNGTTVDVVMDPRTVDSEPKPGMIVDGRFWLTARIAP